jgi:hypothetical protein
MAFTLAVGFYAGRMTKPFPVKAAGRAQIVRVQVPDLGSSVYGAVFPGVTVPGGGTATAISCTTNDNAVGICYVLVQ